MPDRGGIDAAGYETGEAGKEAGTAGYGLSLIHIYGMDNALFRENIIRNMPVFLEHKNAVTNGNSVHFTVQMKNRSGNDAWLQINASCIGYQEGDPVYLAIYIDITLSLIHILAAERIRRLSWVRPMAA